MQQIFRSRLPKTIDWQEINDFFENNPFKRGEILSTKWKESDAFQKFSLSTESMKVLECLHDDLYDCYYRIFARDENGNENRPEEYRLLREALFLKYGSISESVLSGIYSDYLIADR